MASSGSELARTLRERRRALGLTRTRLAQRTGLTAVDVAGWERGERMPDADQIVILADAVGLDDDETRAWLDAIVSVDVTGPEVAVRIVDGDAPRANPFSQRLRPLRGEMSRLGRIRAKVEALRPDTSGEKAPPQQRDSKPVPKRPAPSRRSGLVAARRGRAPGELPSVFPESPIGSYDPAVRVYSTTSATLVGSGEEQLYRLRRIRTTGVLIGLGIALWWAFGALGEGLADVFDLFRSSTETTLVP